MAELSQLVSEWLQQDRVSDLDSPMIGLILFVFRTPLLVPRSKSYGIWAILRNSRTA